jgi:hypothetical protein
MAQAISRRPLTAEAGIRARVSPCGVLWWAKWHWDRFFPSSSVFLCQYHSTVGLHTHVSSGGQTIGPLVAAVQRHNMTPST